MKAKKQKNGKYRVRIYDYTDSYGKQHMKSFTAFSKDECYAKAEEYKKSKGIFLRDYTNMLFKDACELYINSRSNVLSPTTIKKYRFLQHNYEFLDEFKLKDIDSTLVQEYINQIALKLSYKSVKDRYAFLRSVIVSYRPSVTLRVVLPRKTKTSRYLPKDEEILLVLENCKDKHMKLAICLGAYGMMRAGEISAFRKEDLTDDTLHVHRNMVRGENGYVIKSPKTLESDRYIVLPHFVAEMIREMPDDTIGINPNAITNRWNRLLSKLDIPHFRFHDLRHYACSTYHDMGVSDAIIQKIGGWSADNSETMKRVYRHAKLSSLARQTANVNEFFENLNKKEE